MKIRYFGHSCFEYTFLNGVKVVTDPFTKIGYELPKSLQSDIVTVSHGHFDHNYTQAIKGNPQIVQGEKFEGKGVLIERIASFHDEKQGALRGKNDIYKIYADSLCVCHFGDLGEPCSMEILDKIGQVDVLCIPIGGTYTITATEAKKYVEALAPNVVIPMHYKGKDCALDITDERVFLTLFDKENIQKVKGEIILSKEEIKGYEKKIIFMERREEV